MLPSFGSFSPALKPFLRSQRQMIERFAAPGLIVKEIRTQLTRKMNLHGPLPEFKVERFYGWDACKRSLSSSECEPVTLKHLLDLANSSPEMLSLWEDMSLGYSVQAGHPLLRSKVAARYKCIESGDVGIFAPQESLGSVVIKWNVRNGKGQWYFDLEELERYFQLHSPTLLVLNVPHNPTGAMMSKDDLNYLIELCRKHNTWLFADEMYRGLEHDDIPRLENVCDVYPERGISLGGLSKTFGLPGLRIGWVVSCNQGFISKVLALKDYTTICTSSPSEILGIVALENAVELESSRKRIVSSGLGKVKKFVSVFEDIGEISWVQPEGGTFALLKLEVPKQASKYCDLLIKRQRLMLLPASLFGFDDAFVRVCYGKTDIAERLCEWKNDIEGNGWYG